MEEKTDDKKVLEKVVPTLLRDGTTVSVSVTNPNILHKWGICKNQLDFIIKAPCLGVLYQISDLLLKLSTENIQKDTKIEDLLALGLKNIIDNKDILLKVAGWGMLNKKAGPSGKLLRFLNNNMTPGELIKIVTIIVSYMDVAGFLAFTVSTKKINLLLEADTQTPGQ